MGIANPFPAGKKGQKIPFIGDYIGPGLVGTKNPPQNGAFFSRFGLNSGKIEGIGLICKGLKS